jgi:hypothetical protein
VGVEGFTHVPAQPFTAPTAQPPAQIWAISRVYPYVGLITRKPPTWTMRCEKAIADWKRVSLRMLEVELVRLDLA